MVHLQITRVFGTVYISDYILISAKEALLDWPGILEKAPYNSLKVRTLYLYFIKYLDEKNIKKDVEPGRRKIRNLLLPWKNVTFLPKFSTRKISEVGHGKKLILRRFLK